MIDKVTAQRIKDTAEIVDVVSDYVHLVRRGANYMGLCPFHNERTPSFSVNPRRNFCFCFSCRKGGSPVNFIMQKEGISYHDALLHLARKYGIEVKERELTDEEKRLQSERESMLVANEWAMNYFEKTLRETAEGRDVGLQYFYQRGLTDEAIKAYRLGYALDRGSAMLDEIRKAGYDPELFYTLGLIGKSKEGRFYDRFRGRVIYPIQNSSGKVIAFGGRDLKGGPAKYINSPESELYKKSSELYGIYQAKNQIGREEEGYLVEGYMDVIGMWQSGLRNVVASSGTALTDGQINLLHRFAKRVTLIYDGDNAGIKAALRAIDMLLLHKMEVKVLLLPDGHDPDSFAREHTPEQFREYVAANATDIIRFKTDILMKSSAGDPQARTRAIHSIVNSLACIADPIQQNVYIQECAVTLGVDETLIASETRRARLGVLEQERIKRERDRQSTEMSEPPVTGLRPVSSPSAEAAAATAVNQPRAASQPARRELPLEPFEREVVRLCIRYGLVNFCMAADENGNETALTGVDYVASYLEANSMAFTSARYERIYSIMKEIQIPFREAIDEFYASRLGEQERMRAEGVNDIASRGLSMAQIEIEEKRLEERLAGVMNDELLQFTLDYPAKILASHEDDDVRSVSTDLITDRNVLSKIYARIGNMESEFDQLVVRLPRALDEWRDAILGRQIADVMEKISRVSADSTVGNLEELIMQLNALQTARREMAKEIGERILNPGIIR